MRPSEGVTLSHVKVYQMLCDETPHYSPEEFCEDFWLTPQEIISRYQNGEEMKISLPNLVEHFFIKNRLR